MKDSMKRRNAVARIAAAENKSDAIAAEAKRAGKSFRTVQRWVEAAGGSTGDGQNDVPQNVTPPEKPAENPVLDTLLKDEGAGGKGPEGPPTPTEIRAAVVDSEVFCVETIASMQAMAGSFLVSMRYSPPLDATSPEVVKMFALTKPAELAIRANAPRLYPILAKALSNFGALLVAVGGSALGMVMGLEGLAKSKGWEPKKKTEDKPNPFSGAKGGSPESLRAQIDAARADLGKPTFDPNAVKIDTTPASGTINAPAA